MRSTATMTFTLRRGTTRALVRITQRFAVDGAHARQTVRGSIAGGTGHYRGARGTIVGGGVVVDRRSGPRSR